MPMQTACFYRPMQFKFRFVLRRVRFRSAYSFVGTLISRNVCNSEIVYRSY